MLWTFFDIAYRAARLPETIFLWIFLHVLLDNRINYRPISLEIRSVYIVAECQTGERYGTSASLSSFIKSPCSTDAGRGTEDLQFRVIRPLGLSSVVVNYSSSVRSLILGCAKCHDERASLSSGDFSDTSIRVEKMTS